MMPTIRQTLIAMSLIGAIAAGTQAASTTITAEGIVLIVNKQQPAGRELAERYAKLRNVPADRIIEIDVPDEIELAPEVFETSVARVVRHEIDSRQLRDKVQCAVTFYGVPLRVRDRPVTPFERNETKAILEPTITALRGQFQKSVEAAEAIAARIDPSFKPDSKAVGTEQLRMRGVAAEQHVNAAMNKANPEQRAQMQQLLDAARGLQTQMPPIPNAPTSKPAAPVTQEQVTAWLAKPGDPEARKQLRDALYFNNSVFQMLMVVETQQRAIAGGEGEASVDSELSCLWLGDYTRQKWVTNPWHWNAPANVAQLRPQVLRVARIDGPTPEIARRSFEECIGAEARGLAGDVVLDARGITGGGSVGSYDSADSAIRNVAKYLPGNDGLKAVFDNNPSLLPDHSSEKAAIYCGWYSVGKYKPTVKCVPGSIAWHVASFEMQSLRPTFETGWCRGLMLDGADVTIGPVGEPYLIAFPPADEMLGLVMTGKPTLAEAYWATIPITSWKMVLIGDPLYRPFATKPAVQVTQLAPGLAKYLAE